MCSACRSTTSVACVVIGAFLALQKWSVNLSCGPGGICFSRIAGRLFSFHSNRCLCSGPLTGRAHDERRVDAVEILLQLVSLLCGGGLRFCWNIGEYQPFRTQPVCTDQSFIAKVRVNNHVCLNFTHVYNVGCVLTYLAVLQSFHSLWAVRSFLLLRQERCPTLLQA